ncbi:DUF1643 domain-containing protein [Kutzneria buriramensis]|uniref:DUF1643 domain-containing protein n=1 Tax=Kutzneria buriramensis TaxID=1045776 RepID=A0A3E0G814_9PSEU|nr:DUF1643 domain-containing protein [Kutzneria buriramensis]REH18296.1 hypothetical protein BCF44_13651 [Kutzneria buriramensis]
MPADPIAAAAADTAALDLFTAGTAVLSPCGTYRYELRRVWGDPTRLACWIMLNPSRADATADDPTIRRCVGYAKAWQLGGIVVRNLFALRATDPAALADHSDPIGPDNDHWLTTPAPAAVTVAAWGVHGTRHGRDQHVRALLAARGITLHHLGALTRDGCPRHPLYLPASAQLRPLPPASAPYSTTRGVSDHD